MKLYSPPKTDIPFLGVWLERLVLELSDSPEFNGLTLKTLDITHTATEADDHALEIVLDAAAFGDVKALDIDYITGAIAKGQDEGIILINIDETLATGGDVFGLEVLATDGSANIHGMKVGPVVAPIHQDSGTFANPTTATDNTPDTDVNAMKDGSIGTTTAIFDADNEYIIIGAATAFQDMELVFTTPASVNIKPTFWYSIAGAGQFTQFTPVDGTDGCKHTGVISWDASDLTSHVAADAPPGGTGTFDIKIIRTKNNLNTSPILGYAKTAATTEYIWDKNGDVSIRRLTTTGGIHVGGTADPGEDNLVVDGDIYLVDTKSIGIGPALERLEFYTAGYAAFMGCNVGIGTVTPTVPFAIRKDLNGNVLLSLQNTGNATPYGMNIDFTAASPDNQTQYFLKGEDSTAAEFHIWSDGSFVQASDARTKVDIANAGSWLNKVMNLPIKEYEKANDKSERLHVGIIASEITKDFGHLVNMVNRKTDIDYKETKLEDQYMLDYIGFVPIALKVIQELRAEKNAEIEELTQRIELLEAA